MAQATRRDFLKKAIKFQGQLVAANVTVYLVGSMFKSLGGSMVAGAKFYAHNRYLPEICASAPDTYGPYNTYADCDAARPTFLYYGSGCWPATGCTNP